MDKYTAIRVDDEFSADAWWCSIRERYPKFAKNLSDNGCAVIKASLWGELAGIAGFTSDCEYAPTALIDCGAEGDQYADVVAGRHSVFDELA